MLKEHLFSHYLVTAGFGTEIRIWDLDWPTKPKYIIKGRTSEIVLVVVDEDNHDNPWIYTYAREGVITVWDGRSKLCLQVCQYAMVNIIVLFWRNTLLNKSVTLTL